MGAEQIVQLNSAFTLFLSLLVEAIPFLLLGVLFSGLLMFFVDERWLLARLPRQPMLGALVGSLIGMVFPVCECGNVPVARRLLTQGAPASVAVGFLLAAPTINPIVFWATWTAFRDQPEVVFLRIGFSLAIATVIGTVFSSQSDIRPLLQQNLARLVPAPPVKARSKGNATQPESALLQSGTFWAGGLDVAKLQRQTGPEPTSRLPLSQKWNLLLENSIQELRELGAVLVLGSAIAAVVQVFIPREVVLSLGQGPVTSILAMLLLATIISICSTVDAFFALSFAGVFTSGALLAFLVFGPMIDLKSIGLMLSIFRGRAVFYLFALAGLMTFILTLFVNLYVS
jgi:uncharacterized protein